MSHQPAGVHLVGSIIAESAEEVFNIIPAQLPQRLKRLSDGETGARNMYVLGELQNFKHIPEVLPPLIRQMLGIQHQDSFDEVDVERVRNVLEDRGLVTGYDGPALASFDLFDKAQRAGKIQKDIRFQVCLPTSFNVMAFMLRPYTKTVEPFYAEALARSVRCIQNNIPKSRLAIQWDCAIEFGHLDAARQDNVQDMLGGAPVFEELWFEKPKQSILERIVKHARLVDEDVEMGFHFCYGDLGHVHFVQPKDAGTLVEAAMYVLANVGRKVDWIHMPVPKGRKDKSYFEPLKQLVRLLQEHDTELYLGLVHSNDEQGTAERIKVAQGILGRDTIFGIGTECGFGRTPKEEVDSCLRIMRRLSAPINEAHLINGTRQGRRAIIQRQHQCESGYLR